MNIMKKLDDKNEFIENVEIFQVLTNSIVQAIWETDADGLAINDWPSWRAYTGQTYDEMTGYGWFNAIHQDDRAYAERQWKDAVAASKNVNAEFRIKGPNGEWRWTNIISSPIRDCGGNIKKWVGINIDISERKHAEEALRKSEEKYRTLFNSLDEGFCIIEVIFDNQGKAVDWRYIETNEQFLKQGGVSDSEGKLISELVPELEASWFEFYGNVAVTGVPARVENEVKTLDSWYEVYAFKIGEQDSRKVGVAFYDITERKKSEKQIHELVEQLNRSNENKNAFIATLSHELRNPLASIMMGISLSEHSTPGGEQSLRGREIIKRQAGQLSRLVDSLLDVTHINNNKIKLIKESIELNSLVNHAAADYNVEFAKKGVELKVQLAPETLYMEADAARLIQVIGNLLDNAVKFTDSEDSVEVAVTAGKNREEALIAVRDTGAGLPVELLPDLFEPFTQADKTLNRSGGGLGLGLAVVRGIVELHHGSISVSSKGPGKGTEFIIRLPVQCEKEKTQEKGRDTDMESSKTLNILMIDDNQDLTEVTSELLSLLGYEVITASNGSDGIAKAKEYHPEVILCDIGLPGMSGYDVARSIRRDHELKDVFLVAMSGYAQHEDLQRSREAGFNKHLAKPVSIETLKSTLDQFYI
ncbi:MAG: ATP-binding protein [Clostridiaceae bacterium]